MIQIPQEQKEYSSANIAELYRTIQEEQKLYSIRRDQHLQEVHILLEQTPTTQKNQLIDQMAHKSSLELQQLKSTALDVEQEVQSVSKQATKAMNSFEQLRNQKQNIDKILNALSALGELKRVRSELPKAIESRDINACLKLAQSFLQVEDLLMQEYCYRDFSNVKSLIEEDLVELYKHEFEDSLKKNDIQRISLCACLAKVLSQESENSLDQVQEVHGRELRKQLLILEDQMFEKVNNNYEEYIFSKQQREVEDDLKEYDFPFLWHFVKILEKVNEQGERFAENILSFYGQQGLNQLQYYLLEEVSNPFLFGVIKRLKSFYDIEREPKRQHLTLLLALQNKEANIDTNYLIKLSLHNEEVATLTSQFNQFLQHISQLGQVKDDKPQPKINQIFSSLSINNTIIDLLQQYLLQTKKETHLNLLQLFHKAESLQTLWNFDKQKIVPLSDSKEQLAGNGFHEWLEEVFFIVKHAAKLAMSTGNQMIASTLISYINSDILSEELYQVIVSLINKYLKKEYFSQSSISINNKYTVHNAFIILIFNIISNIPRYLRTLKSQLYNELQAGGSHSYQSNQMIVGAIEELVDVNFKKYTLLINDKIKILAENLKFTVRDLFDQLKSLSFILNENVIVEQEREYTKLISHQFKLVFGAGLEQWRHQLTHDNYEALSEQLCHSIARTLEQIVFSKQYHQMGAIILEKEIRSIINFFPQVTSLHVKQCFARLQIVCETLMLESVKDMEEFLSSSAVGELSIAELKKVSSLRLDLVRNNK